MKTLTAKHITINGEEIAYYPIDNDINGNPRCVVHFLSLGIKPEDYGNIPGLAAKKYHNKRFGGGYVFQAWYVREDLAFLLKQVKTFYEVHDNLVTDQDTKLRNFKSIKTAKFYKAKIQPRYDKPLQVGRNNDEYVVFIKGEETK